MLVCQCFLITNDSCKSLVLVNRDVTTDILSNQAPYVMVSGKPKWWGTPGNYTIQAIPYSRKNGKGVPGSPMIVNFTITESQQRETATASARLVALSEERREEKK